MREVAKEAKVSVATVSRVLNKSEYVSSDITKRVLQASKKLGYFPNSIARSLKINSTHTIGFLVSDISNPYYITIARAVEEVVKNHNYNLILCSTENKKDRELSYLELLFSKNIDALILNTTGKNDDFIVNMNKTIPMVLINRRIKSPDFIGDVVDTDNTKGTYILTKQLLELGHRDIFVINGPRNLSNAQQRMLGFKQAMLEYSITVDGDYPFQYEGDFTLDSGYDAIMHLCSLPQKPTAVISLNNMMAIGALKCFKALNINAPEDLSIVSYDSIDNMELIAVRPTVVSFDINKFGTRIGEYILERVKDNNIPNREFVLEPKVIQGNAVGFPTDNMKNRDFNTPVLNMVGK